jgi:hypothetical protein
MTNDFSGTQPEFRSIINKYPIDVKALIDEAVDRGSKRSEILKIIKDKYTGDIPAPSVFILNSYVQHRKEITAKRIDTMLAVREEDRKGEIIQAKIVNFREISPGNLRGFLEALLGTYVERIELLKELQHIDPEARMEQVLANYLGGSRATIETLLKMEGKLDNNDTVLDIMKMFLKQLTPLIYQAYVKVNGTTSGEDFFAELKRRLDNFDFNLVIQASVLERARNSKN